MLHASVQRDSLVVAAEGLLKRGGSKCVVHADGLRTRTNMSTYCRKEPGTCFPSCVWTSQPEGARVPNRIKTVICVRRLYTYMCVSMVFSPTDCSEHVWYRGVSLAMQNVYCRTRVVVRIFQQTSSADVRMPRVCALRRVKSKDIRSLRLPD